MGTLTPPLGDTVMFHAMRAGQVHSSQAIGMGAGREESQFSRTREEARSTPFCPSQEKFHTCFLPGVSNISEAPYKIPLKFLL